LGVAAEPVPPASAAATIKFATKRRTSMNGTPPDADS